MTLHVAPAEWFWLLVNGASVVLTVWAFREARVAEDAVRALNGKAREIVAAGNVRREAFRLVTQVLLLAVVLPGLFVDRPIVLWGPSGPNWPLLALILAPVPILGNSLLDFRDRRRLLRQTRRDADNQTRRASDVAGAVP